MSGMCGVLGIENAAEHVVLALGGGLEHRGAHKTGATGVVSQYIGEDGIQHQHSHRGYGAVGTVYFEQNDVARLTGECALGYVGPAEPLLSIHDIPPYGQRFPFIGREDARIAICYDGVITNKKDLCQEAVSGGYALTSPKSPVVFLANLLAQHTGRSGGTLVAPDEPNALHDNLSRQVATSITDRVFALAQKLQGTFALAVMVQDMLIGVCSPYGARSLVVGRLSNGAMVLASESCALDIIDAKLLYEVSAGEMVVVHANGTIEQKYPYAGPSISPTFCAIGRVYYQRFDSRRDGQTINDLREAMGARLAEEHPVAVDVVIAIANSAIPVAVRYGKNMKADLRPVVRGQHASPGLIQLSHKVLGNSATIRYRFVESAVHGKRVALVDAGFLRTTDIARLVRLLREANAAAVHVLIGTPLLRSTCPYGATRLLHEYTSILCKSDNLSDRDQIGADSVAFLSLEGLRKIFTDMAPNSTPCLRCFECA
ncbi:MAG: hypothetical protein COT39_00020 [Parcubacteria group bacterium CG08_land_8_20_14_0_20_48_21]|nr:MAG: hypothetical protein AUK21_01915 [Parcubacteria group bacterium CG2_30_48_51]PIS33289.1 MAG: hypothetical protein COT39_00020 [Parcubacteria group bacterium CG08_land_8_20_14_0_20_48_21]PIW79367.1 MAG: hypothetical protein COZ99_01380 [Parcubacteria group bacterium CG_4_8_14_3_um_filter_48_16]PIZ77589.1 MAG: hypothetical protein COY03_02340 [bacterium CG_4_10_14_0_2_um_filter_48_144]PJC39694.1 MAG: hypothetical protein CO043_02895 [Parcubacteria group bacterium CG_4_9_14_0_2_um_filter_4